ncbi:NAD(P)H-hydrate dehydratase [Patescibacteria group bacterium]|nr:NAD(P)H-hydrate dehydratase [Patescibacteria group bacterium]
MEVFDKNELKKLYKPALESIGEDNGQVTIIGGSKLFHGAPLLSLKVASRVVDMVFFATPELSIGKVAEKIKSKLFSFMWVPWDEVEEYVKKSDSVLIGPGFMRFRSERVPENKRHTEYDNAAKESREITQRLLESFPEKRWVIDAGSLQVMDPDWIPKNAILTPNRKELELLFGNEIPDEKLATPRAQKGTEDTESLISSMAKKYNCIVNSKGPTNLVCSPDKCVEVRGGNPGLTKGGTGDVLAGLVVSLLAKNDPFLAAASASYVAKAAADELYEKVGTNFSADDLADKIPKVLHELKT